MDVMNYARFGEGEEVFFLHGWGGGTASFWGVANSLANEYRVTLVDFAGFGKTPEPPYPFTLADYAGEVRALMNALSVTSAHFVCHSFGARVGIRLAASSPELVEKLIIVDGAGMKPRRKPAYYVKRAVHRVLKLFGKGLKGSSDYRVLSPVMKQTFKNVVGTYQDGECARIGAETAIFWGRKDKDTPPYMARRLRRSIRNSGLFWLDGDHFAYLHDTSFLPVLRAFLRG